MRLPGSVERLRAMGDRPVPEKWRIGGVVITLVIVGALLILFRPSRDTTPPPPTSSYTTAPAPPVVAPAPVTPPAQTTRVSRRDLAEARRTARRFLSGYLPFTYGRGSVSSIPMATSNLRASLQQPRVPPDIARLHPRVKSLEAESSSPITATVVALVTDARRNYSVTVALTRTSSGWRVNGLRGG